MLVSLNESIQIVWILIVYSHIDVALDKNFVHMWHKCKLGLVAELSQNALTSQVHVPNLVHF